MMKEAAILFCLASLYASLIVLASFFGLVGPL
jgi:hypothetical protein